MGPPSDYGENTGVSDVEINIAITKCMVKFGIAIGN